MESKRMNNRFSTICAFSLCFFMVVTSCSKSSYQAPPASSSNTSLTGVTPSIGPANANHNLLYYSNAAPTTTVGCLGDFYLDVANGLLYGPKSAYNWGTILTIPGSKGAGNQVFSGAGAPPSTLGDPGDYYLDTSNFLLYATKTANGWTLTPLNLQSLVGG